MSLNGRVTWGPGQGVAELESWTPELRGSKGHGLESGSSGLEWSPGQEDPDSWGVQAPSVPLNPSLTSGLNLKPEGPLFCDPRQAFSVLWATFSSVKCGKPCLSQTVAEKMEPRGGALENPHKTFDSPQNVTADSLLLTEVLLITWSINTYFVCHIYYTLYSYNKVI